MAGVVGESVALAERAVDSAAGYAADVAPSPDAGGVGFAQGAAVLVAGGLAGVSVGLIWHKTAFVGEAIGRW